METTAKMKELFEVFLAEDEKAVGGNKSAVRRARVALNELGKLCKVRRMELSELKADAAKA